MCNFVLNFKFKKVMKPIKIESKHEKIKRQKGKIYGKIPDLTKKELKIQGQNKNQSKKLFLLSLHNNFAKKYMLWMEKVEAKN